MLSDFEHQLILTVVDKGALGLITAYAAYAFGRGMERFKRDQAHRATLRAKALIEIFGKCHLLERDFENAENTLIGRGWRPTKDDVETAMREAHDSLLELSDAEKKSDEIERITRENLFLIGMPAHDLVSEFLECVAKCGCQALVIRAWRERPETAMPAASVVRLIQARQEAWERLNKSRRTMETLVRDA